MARINAMSQAQLMKLLLDGQYSVKEMAGMTGLHYVTVLQYTKELHKAGVAHISKWNKDGNGRDSIKIYKIGSEADAKRKSMTAAERQRKYRERLKSKVTQ